MVLRREARIARMTVRAAYPPSRNQVAQRD